MGDSNLTPKEEHTPRSKSSPPDQSHITAVFFKVDTMFRSTSRRAKIDFVGVKLTPTCLVAFV